MIRKMIRKIMLDVSFKKANKRLLGVFEALHRQGIMGEAGRELGNGFMSTAVSTSNGIVWGVRKYDAVSIEDARLLRERKTVAAVKHSNAYNF